MLEIPEVAGILLITLLLFGPKKLPEVGKTLGSALREFRKATREFTSSLENLSDDEEPSSHEKAGDSK
jgi:TatA/E family protein of Tat protein translocase